MNASPYPTTANEPKVHPIIRKSFVFVPSAGMRLAPEVLVLELMREVFFERHYGDVSGTKDLNPEELEDDHRYAHSDRERAVLHAMRGRRKKSKNAMTQRYFAPAYPQLARQGWLGKNRERVINSFLLAGPLSQHFWGKGPQTIDGRQRQQELTAKIWKALLGHRSGLDGDLRGAEILAATLGSASFEASSEVATDNLQEKTNNSAVIRLEDALASRITQDFAAICDLETELPRMQWLHVLMTFLRFALPMWLLAQMRITTLLHSWLIDAVDNRSVATTETIRHCLLRRNEGALHPTLTPTREIFEHIERYMKCRVEIDLLLYCVERVRPDALEGKVLELDSGGRDVLSIDGLLALVRDAAADIRQSERFIDIAAGCNVETFLTREGEKFAAWRDALMRGQGKNIDEFFRVLYRAELGDESGGYLLIPEGRGFRRGFRVFPGQLLLKTITYLAAHGKRSSRVRGGAGKLILEDVEDHFFQYGVDFSMAADARPLLMRELQAMGLLTGSPDAGSSVAVACPY